MKIIIIYNSKTGFTKKYAHWIAEELNCNVLPYDEFLQADKTDITKNDIIIFGSGILAGKIWHLDKIKTHFASHKNLIIFATGATPAAETETITKVWASNLTEDEAKRIPHFYMQSGLNYEKMGFLNRLVMKAVAKLSGDKNGIGSSFDVSSKEYIVPLVNFVKSIVS